MRAFFRKMSCKIGWHSIFVGFKETGFDGASVEAECKWCNHKGLIDSQGNLF